jgi:hypothetical protein
MRTLCLLLVLASMLSAQKHELLLDCSASMEGFFQEGSINHVDHIIDNACRVPHSKFGFIDDRVVELQGSIHPDRFGMETHISQAFQNRLDSGSEWRVIWLLTDNIQTGKQVDQDMSHFYDLLQRGDRVTSVCLYPMMAAFEGLKYDAERKHFHGTSGLLLYQIEVDGDENSGAEQRIRLLSNIKDGLKKTGWLHDGVRIRPFEACSIDIRSDREFKPGERDTVEFTSSGGAFPIGRRIKEKLTFYPHSMLSEFRIAHVDVHPATMQVYHRDFTVGKGDIYVECNPNYIKNLEAGDSVQEIVTAITIREFGLRNSLASWKRSFDRNNDSVFIALDLVFRFSKEDIHFNDGFVRKFDGAIPDLDRLASNIYADTNIVQSKKLFLKFPVCYPSYPIFAIYGSAIALLLIAGWLVMLFRHRTCYTVICGSDSAVEACPVLYWTHRFEEFTLVYIAGSWRIKPMAGYQILEGPKDRFAVNSRVDFKLERDPDAYQGSLDASGLGGSRESCPWCHIEPRDSGPIPVKGDKGEISHLEGTSSRIQEEL